MKYLNEHSASPQDWAVEFELSEANARVFSDAMTPIQVAGGAAASDRSATIRVGYCRSAQTGMRND